MLEYLTIKGGARLEGTVRTSGAKNSALPLLISTLLTSEKCVLENVPDLEDIGVTLRLLKSFGAEAEFSGNSIAIRTKRITAAEAPYSLVKALRASFWVLGPLIARHGKAMVSLPGGDAIGSRPVDLHLNSLVRMGADIRLRHGVVCATAPGGLRGQKIKLDYPSVGATHQLLMTASLIPGETIIEGAAKEPEVSELAGFLAAMGAEIEGAGTDKIRIKGRSELGGASCEIAGDRIEAATYLLAGAMTRGRVVVRGINREKLSGVTQVLEEAGCLLISTENSISVTADHGFKAVSFATEPFPGVATDVQPMLMAALTLADGQSVIEETVFDNRFGHVAEYRRLGAKIRLDGRVAFVEGVKSLSAAPVEATDIRAAAGLVLMGLVAEGITELSEIHHLDRGYDSMAEKLRALGADIARVPVYEEKELVFGC